MTPAARPSRCRTETRSCQPTSARSGRPDNFSAGAWRRPANSVTPLPGSAAGRRTWGPGHPGRDGSRRRPGSHHGPEDPGGATRGSWVAGAGWDPGPRRTRSSRSVRPPVRPSRHRPCAPKRLGEGALPSGSAGRRPRAPIRTIVSAAAAAAAQTATALCSAPPRPPAPTPSRPRGERRGRRTVPGPHVAAPPRGVAAVPCRPRPHGTPDPARTPSPAPQRASRAPPRGAHGPVRPASLQPLQTPAAGGLREPTHGERGGFGVGEQRHTRVGSGLPRNQEPEPRPLPELQSYVG